MLNKNNKIRSYYEHSAADSLRELLDFHNITQTEFAQHIGVSQSYISDILSRKKFMSTDVALAIEEATGVDAEFLLKLDLSYQLNDMRLTGTKKNIERYDWATA